MAADMKLEEGERKRIKKGQNEPENKQEDGTEMKLMKCVNENHKEITE